MLAALAKIPLKIARLSFRLAKGVVKRAMGRGGDSGSTASGSNAHDSGAIHTAPPPRPPPEPAGPSPFEVQVDPGHILSRIGDGETITFIDVRQPEELAQTGHIEGALHIPSQDLPRRLEELDKESEFVVYCAAGIRSLDAAMFLREKGFEKAWSLGGGLPHWEQDGGTLVTA